MKEKDKAYRAWIRTQESCLGGYSEYIHGDGRCVAAHVASATFAAAASAGVLTASTITADSSADATGTATFFSLLTSAGVRKADGTVGTTGSDLNLNTTSIVAGAQVSVSSLTVTSGN